MYFKMLPLKSVIPVTFCLIFAQALPSDLLWKETDPRYQYAVDSKGESHLVDLWMNLDNLQEAARFNPAASNGYHLFTRKNPSVSQPIVLNNADVLANSNFDSSKRTIVLIHGWNGDVMSEGNLVLIPAFLSAEDVNIIVVDWSAGASSINYRVVIANTITSGVAVARFIDWLNQASGATPDKYHIVGHGFGGHQAGIVGRNAQGNIGYITGLNPALVGWVTQIDKFQPNDGLYTEIIHTNLIIGYPEELGHVDFYPNAGISMPGCDSNACDDAMSYFYLAESLSSRGFTGRRCLNFAAAVLSMCNTLPGRLEMGGLLPKTGSRGAYLLETNALPPFSQG